MEVRFTAGLPAFGRKIAGKHAEDMLLDEIPGIVSEALFFESLSEKDLSRHVEAAEDADRLRDMVVGSGLVAFVADGSFLPRLSGIDDRPLESDQVVPFQSPDSMRESFELPNAGTVTGMGIKTGVTLIVGGGYHGKSTLLNAIELGIYNHIPGDCRERVVTDPKAVKIRAEDGRRVEAVQAGGTALLIDEDTSATNFMIRDHRMQELIAKEQEPITPFIDKVRQLHSDYAVSTILVIGGSGDYFDVADAVVRMREYLPMDVTAEARKIAERYRTERRREGGEAFGTLNGRAPLKESFDPRKGKKPVKVQPRGTRALQFGTDTIDLSGLEQLVDTSQTRTIGEAILYAMKFMDGTLDVKVCVEKAIEAVREKGLDELLNRPFGDYAAVRGLEITAAINRLRTLKVRGIKIRKEGEERP